MLERVALGQTRFATPGVVADARGVTLGRYGLLSFASIEGLVAWLRSYTAEAALDDLLAELTMTRAESGLRTPAFLLRLPVATSYVLDRAGRIARLLGAAVYTGTARHYVKYRDPSSPYGYDVKELGGAGEDDEIVLHGEGGRLVLKPIAAIEPRSLLLRLSLQRERASKDDLDPTSTLWAVVRLGLLGGVARYLDRARVLVKVAHVVPASDVPRDDPQTRARGFLELSQVPPRVVQNLRHTPGITLYRPVLPQLGVELGFMHPVSLASVSALFPGPDVWLLGGRPERVDILRGPVEMSSLTDLAPVRWVDGAPQTFANSGAEDTFGVTLRLLPSATASRRVVGALLSWQQLPLLKKLVYALPPTMLRAHRLAATSDGVLLVCRDGVDVIPFGTLLGELAPGLLAPLGFEPVPRVSPESLAQATGHVAGRVTVLLHDAESFAVKESDLVLLERRTLSRVRVPLMDSSTEDLTGPGWSAPRLVNDPVGAFALWSFPAPKE